MRRTAVPNRSTAPSASSPSSESRTALSAPGDVAQRPPPLVGRGSSLLDRATDARHLVHEVVELGLDLVDPDLPEVGRLEELAREAEGAALGVQGVSKSGGASASAGIGGMVLVTSHGFKGAYLASRYGISMTAIAGEGTAMERDYDYSSTLHAACAVTQSKSSLSLPVAIRSEPFQIRRLEE